ncbi:MAG: hypothetical protein MJ010_06370 [Paludibacteraceae bacterium]|nr:hypothetical protein [Paludibacteraceae bacterium]
MKKVILSFIVLFFAVNIQAGSLYQWSVYGSNYSVNRRGDINFSGHLPFQGNIVNALMLEDNMLYIEGAVKNAGTYICTMNVTDGSITRLKEPINSKNIHYQKGVKSFCEIGTKKYSLESDGLYKEEGGKNSKFSNVTGNNIAYVYDLLWISSKDKLTSVNPETGEVIDQWPYSNVMIDTAPNYMFETKEKDALVLVTNAMISVLFRADYPSCKIVNYYSSDKARSQLVADWQYVPSVGKVALANATRLYYTPYCTTIGSWDGTKWSGVKYDMHQTGEKLYLKPELVISAFAIKDNSIYVARKAGLAIIDKQTGSVTEVPAYTATVPDRMCFDKDGILWACTSKGIVSFDGKTCTLYDKKSIGMPTPDDAHQMTCDENGVIWVAADNGLFRKNADGWTVFNKKNGVLPFNGVRKFTFRNGRVLILKECGMLGLIKECGWLENDKYTPISLDGYISDKNSDFDNDGRLWFVSEKGINCLDETGVKTVISAAGTPLELPIISGGLYVADGKVILIVTGYNSNVYTKGSVTPNMDAATAEYRSSICKNVSEIEDIFYSGLALVFDLQN